MKLKKAVALLLVTALTGTMLTGCGSSDDETTTAAGTTGTTAATNDSATTPEATSESTQKFVETK